MKFIAAVLIYSLPCWAGYSGYRLFSIDHTQTGSADSANFTLLLSGTFADYATVANGGKVQNTVSCGVNSITCPADLIFASDPGCTSPLPGWEFEQYTPSTGQIIAWVIVSNLSSSVDTQIYGCVGNSAVVTFQGGSTGANYDANTLVVMHFGNGSTLSANDSSANNNNGTLINSPTATAGVFSGGVYFNGSSQAIHAASFPWTPGSAITVSFWAYMASADGGLRTSAFTIGNDNSNRIQAHMPWKTGIVYWDYWNNGTTGRVQVGVGSYLDQWTYISMVSSGSANSIQALYMNGVSVASVANSLGNSITGNLYVGGFPGAGYYYKGSMDEFKVANVVRSASWILAEFNNQSNPTAFAVVGTFVSLIPSATSQGFIF